MGCVQESYMRFHRLFLMSQLCAHPATLYPLLKGGAEITCLPDGINGMVLDFKKAEEAKKKFEKKGNQNSSLKPYGMSGGEAV